MPVKQGTKKEVAERAQKLYEAIKNLSDGEELKALCESEKQWLEGKYKPTSMGTILSSYYNKLFDQIELNSSNSFVDETRQGKKAKKHLFHKYCGFSNKDWAARNEESDNIAEKIENAVAIENPDLYVQKASELLLSSDPYEIGSGLIASTGCRPIEILLTGKFSAIEGEAYQIRFEGQAKKRTDKPIFNRPVLFPSDAILKAFNRFRRSPEIKELIEKAKTLTDELKESDMSDDDIDVELKRRIGDSRSRLLWDSSTENFKDIIPPKYGAKYVNNQSLRAAFGAVVTARDADGSDANKMIYFARAIGHIAKDGATTKSDLRRLATTAGYGTYYLPKGVDVEFAPSPKVEKLGQLRCFPSDFERIKKLQEDWGLENQQQVVQALLNLAEETFTNRKEQIKAMENTEKVEPTTIKKEEKDWSSVPSEELKPRKTPGTAKEKLERAIAAIANYNDIQPSLEERWFINPTIVRQLSGCRFEAVDRFFAEFQPMIDSFNGKYFQDLEKGRFHNQKHGKKGIKITDVIRW